MTNKLSKEEINEIIDNEPPIKRHVALDKLKSGELSWKEYIDSLTPEELEEERERKRYWAKVWYQNNKEKKQEYSRERYIKNRDKILAMERERKRERTSRKVICECCGSIYTRNQAQRHFRTQKHQHAVEAQNQKEELDA